MLETNQLSKSFGTTAAVSAVDVQVAPGSIFALLGPNGSGKTTFIRLLSGLLQPTSGTISIAGISMADEPMAAKQLVGYIPDNPEAWGQMTGLEFLHFTGALYNVPEGVRSQRIQALLPRFNLEGIEHTYFEHYSRGNRQKFCILAALLHEPKVLLIDEPIVGLDPDSVNVFEELLKEFTAGGGSVLITTHTLQVAERVADTVGILMAGSLHTTGPLSELRSRHNLSAEASLLDLYYAVVPRPSSVPKDK